MPNLLDEDLLDAETADTADAGGDVPALPLPAPAAAPAQPAPNSGALPPNWWFPQPKAPEIDRGQINAIRDIYNAVPPGDAGKAIEMATRLQGVLGFDADIKAGIPTQDALRKWAPKMYFNHPGAVSRLMQQATPPFSPGVTRVDGERLIQTSPNRYQLLPKPITNEVGPLNARPITTPEGKVLGFGLPSKSGIHTKWNADERSLIKNSDVGHALSAELRSLDKAIESASLKGDKAAEADYEKQRNNALVELRKFRSGIRAPAAFRQDGEGTPPTITTQAEYNALPPGSLYISKNGKPHRKPK